MDKFQLFLVNTVTYVVNWVPFLALRVLKNIADQECVDFPEVWNAVNHQTYFDDVWTGADTA